MNDILIVDDEESIRWVMKKGLEKEGYTVQTAKNSAEALLKIKCQKFFLAFFDIIMPDETGLTLLEKVKQIDNNLFIIIMTAQDTAKNAILAMKKGAYDYITKPFDFDEIFFIVKNVLELQTLKGRICAMEAELKDRFEAGDIIGKSKKMRDIYKIIGKAAASDLPILITGESGTGKELVAKAVHKNSTRSNGPFISINCSAIPRELIESEMFGHERGAFTGAHETTIGKFELANSGTLFLDEIGDMDIELQAKILRVIQEREFTKVGGRHTIKSDVRIISATNQEIEQAIKDKRFRNDLYHRLNVIHIHMPPLRERRNDIPPLVHYFLERSCKDMKIQLKSITKDAMSIMKKYEWKGNVRELENVIKRAVVLSPGQTITAELFPDSINCTYSEGYNVSSDILKKNMEEIISSMIKAAKYKENLYDTIIKKVEKTLIKKILKDTGDNQVKSARLLGINRNTLSRKIKELNILLR